MNAKLAELAELHGIQTSYVDMRSKAQAAPTESVLLALAAMGIPISNVDEAKALLRQVREDVAEKVIEPVLVAWDGKLGKVRKLPSDAKPILILEDNSETPWPPPRRLPMGYHKLVIERDSRTYESLVISAPKRAHFPISGKAWGVFAPVYGLHSKRSMGAGDLSDLEALIDWMDELGGQVAATLPLLPTFLSTPFEPSPYSPISRLFWSEFYINPARSPEFPIYPARRHSKISGRLVDYRTTMARKRSLLETMAHALYSQSGRRREQFEAFRSANPAVEEYGKFRAVADRQRKGWHDWPKRLQRGDLRPGDYSKEDFQYHVYAQWLIQEQMEQLAGRTKRSGCLLYLDLPAGMHAEAYDTWRFPHLFVNDVSVGAPPDRMFTSGQNWSFPPMHPQAMRLDQHRYTIAVIRNHLRFARLLRIDHVMGLHRLFWIPNGLKGDQGLYVRYPADEMYAILSVESHRHDAGIVGENLGLVPAEVNTALDRHNVRQLYILQASVNARTPDKPLLKPKENCVASLNTHDMAPFRSFVEGLDIDDRQDLHFISDDDAVAEWKSRRKMRKILQRYLKKKNLTAASLEFLARSKAGVVLVNLEDLWGESLPQNVPATTTERPNWRRRLFYSLEQIRNSRDIQKLLYKLGELRQMKP